MEDMLLRVVIYILACVGLLDVSLFFSNLEFHLVLFEAIDRWNQKRRSKIMRMDFTSKYVVLVTSEDERYNNGKEDSKGLDFFANNPCKGNFECILTGDNADELMDADSEGLFYQLYETEGGKKIGDGVLTYDSLKDDIEDYEKHLKVILTFKHKSGFTAKMLFDPCDLKCGASELCKYNLIDVDIVRAKEKVKKWMRPEIADECEIISIELADEE